MSVKFKVVKRQNPINRSEEKFYPQAQTSGAVTLETLSRRISRATSASRGDVLLVVSSLVDEIIESLEEGNAVRLGDLGSMRISLKTTGEENAEDVSAANIRTGKIIFTPSVMLKDRVRRLSFRQLVEHTESNDTNGTEARVRVTERFNTQAIVITTPVDILPGCFVLIRSARTRYHITRIDEMVITVNSSGRGWSLGQRRGRFWRFVALKRLVNSLFGLQKADKQKIP